MCVIENLSATANFNFSTRNLQVQYTAVNWSIMVQSTAVFLRSTTVSDTNGMTTHTKTTHIHTQTTDIRERSTSHFVVSFSGDRRRHTAEGDSSCLNRCLPLYFPETADPSVHQLLSCPVFGILCVLCQKVHDISSFEGRCSYTYIYTPYVQRRERGRERKGERGSEREISYMRNNMRNGC